MMGYVFTPIWAALQICFVILFLSSFLEIKRRKDEMVWIAVVAWLVTAIYGLFEVQGIHGYLMYLLAAVLILLAAHGEYGPKGLCLLALAFLIPIVIDMAVLYLTAELSGLTYYLAVTGGKLLPVLLVLALRKFKLLSSGKQTQPDGDMLLLRQHMEMQQESMAALEQNYRMQRKSAHEFEHHMQVLRDLLEHDEVGAARDYLDRLKNKALVSLFFISFGYYFVLFSLCLVVFGFSGGVCFLILIVCENDLLDKPVPYNVFFGKVMYLDVLDAFKNFACSDKSAFLPERKVYLRRITRYHGF